MRAFLVGLAMIFSATLPAGAASIVVKGVKADQGILLVAKYSEKGTWLGKQPLVGMNVPAKRDANGDVVIPIPQKLPAKVAVAVIHDLNANRDMDRNILGIPTEPYGFSRGVRPRFGPPDFEAALTAPDAPITVTVDTLL
jgi:uncharacterized protein (DUF2141 family)